MAAERTFPEQKAAARALVVGDGDFFANGYRDLLGNLDFFLNGVSWLAEQEDRITIRPKSRESSSRSTSSCHAGSGGSAPPLRSITWNGHTCRWNG